MHKRRIISLVIVAFAVLLSLGAASKDEIARLRILMQWRDGQTLADVGAGEGEIGIAAAAIVGDSGKVYLTELDQQKRKALEQTVKREALKNVIVVQAAERRTNLPDNCCDAIVLRRVYHHFTAPTDMDTSLLRSLKPGGELAVIDFPPRPWLTENQPVKGVPANRGGHGIPQNILLQELLAAGFTVGQVVNDWPDDSYCVIFRKPTH
ncbi:MAG TPA: methyltransferase domain-containing protein [Candidatus Sulfotelmatobacter sp.]|nr:methyltransferase domain-containing protein [Candidatus Sulfotelmatobacter sp.]